MTMRRTIAMLALGLAPWTAFAQDSSRREAIESKLNTMAIDVNFQEASLKDVVGYLREYTGLNWLIDPAVDADGATGIALRLRGVKVITALRLVLRDLEMAAVIRDGMIVIVPREALHDLVVTRVYDVRDLLVKINNFAGPRLELLPGQGGSHVGVQVTWVEEPNARPIDETVIDDLIRSNTGGASWDENPNAQIVMSPNGLLMVTQSKKVHAEIERLLGMLRWFK
jgi:hypothetical protein